MPRWLRVFTYKEIEKHYKEQNDQMKSVSKSSNTKTVIPSMGLPKYK